MSNNRKSDQVEGGEHVHKHGEVDGDQQREGPSEGPQEGQAHALAARLEERGVKEVDAQRQLTAKNRF